MKDEIISKGAEATLVKTHRFGKWIVEKKRVPKGYRHASLDKTLRQERTMHEARLLHHAKTIGVKTPVVYAVDAANSTIYLEYFDAPRLKHALLAKKTPMARKKLLCEVFGTHIATLHAHGLVHGDLTTSNALVIGKKEDELVMIDFGLSFQSTKPEDLAVDLVNLKKTFTATHADFPEGWELIQESYVAHGGKKATLVQMEDVEKRIRYA